jgi:hypothetical protein
MVSITGIVWNSENQDDEKVRLILLERFGLYLIHQA